MRGLSAFTELEREVFYGRDTDVDALTRLVTGDNFRAGLLHGEPGVGKTSLLRAGLVPHLRDHGYLALFCHDIHRPIESFMSEVSSMTGLTPSDDETPLAFVTRVVADAIAGQLFIFVLDDVDIALAKGEEAVSDLGNLFARVMGRRYGGRARFLYCCANEQVYRFNALEQRTGSLFPPTNRYELERFAPNQAVMVLERTLALAGVAADQVLAHAVVESLAQSGPILPADIQIAARALIELRVLSREALVAMGGPAELERAWIDAVAASTGNQNGALRLLAELAEARPVRTLPADWLAARASVDPEFARAALAVLVDKGVVVAAQPEASEPPQYGLAHAILLPRVRDISAPARAASRRAYELLGSKVESRKRLRMSELRALRQDGITPATPGERAVVERSKRFYYMVAGALLALPFIMLAVIYLSMSGRYYLDIETPAQGGAAHVVVRAGRPGLASFHWLPSSPAFGSIVADTGLTRAMVDETSFSRSAHNDIAGDISDYGAVVFDIMDPSTRHLIAYAASGDDSALAALETSADGPQQIVTFLEALSPIARASKPEVRVVESALQHAAPSVQRSALRLAGAAAKRNPGAYHDTLAKALTSPDNELRRLAFSAAHALGPDTARTLYQAALATNPEPGPRRELLAMVTSTEVAAETPSADSAASILVNRELPPRTRDKARSLLERAFASDAKGASLAAAKLAGDDKAPDEDRILALRLMRDFAPAEVYPDITATVRDALAAKSEGIRTAALPLYARIDPKDAATELVLLPDKGPLTPALEVATALAWGEIAKAKDRAAASALELLLKHEDTEVRAAAAEAYGNTGRSSQSVLIKLIKNDRYNVALGAANGLALSADAGGSASNAVSGIMQLWKRKGKPRRDAVQIFARMARTQPKAVVDILASSARSKEDTGLHVLGVRGLCNASAAGYRSVRRALIRAAEEGSVEVRRVTMECIVDHPSDVKTATTIASKLAEDPDEGIRTDAARALMQLVNDGKTSDDVAGALASLAADEERGVRTIAIRALAKLPSEATPKGIVKTLRRVFERADESEKVMLLEAAGDLGAVELIQTAITDESPGVRITALDTAIATGTNVPNHLNGALTDSDRQVRIAALERLAANKDKLDQDAIDKALSLAIRDADRDIAQLALTTLARLGSSEDVSARLRLALAQKSEQERVRAASACIGLVERDAKGAIELLTPLLDDPSHDVRTAMLPALATAWNATHTPEQLAAMLRDSERHAMRRITAIAAFLVLARTENGQAAALTELAKVAENGPPLVRAHAELGKGLIESGADGITFLQLLAP